jgi:hypothetical protein
MATCEKYRKPHANVAALLSYSDWTELRTLTDADISLVDSLNGQELTGCKVDLVNKRFIIYPTLEGDPVEYPLVNADALRTGYVQDADDHGFPTQVGERPNPKYHNGSLTMCCAPSDKVAVMRGPGLYDFLLIPFDKAVRTRDIQLYMPSEESVEFAELEHMTGRELNLSVYGIEEPADLGPWNLSGPCTTPRELHRKIIGRINSVGQR